MTISTDSQNLVRIAELSALLGLTEAQQESLIKHAATKPEMVANQRTTAITDEPLVLASEMKPDRKAPDTQEVDPTRVDNLVKATKEGVRVSNQERKVERHGKTVNHNTAYSYNELRAVMKELGLKASGSWIVLRERLERARTNTLVESDRKKVKPERKPRTKKEKAPKRTSKEGLDYRQSQRLVKWAKENLVGYVAPCKNTGWDNVLENIDAIYNCSHFWNLANGDNQAAKEEMMLMGLCW